MSGIRTTLENCRHAQAAAAAQYLLARVEGAPVAAGFSGVFPWAQDDPYAWVDVNVLPAHRSRGLGSELLRRVSARASELGKHGIQLEVRSDDPHSIRFVENRGFEEIEREEEVELDLTALTSPPAVTPPAGIELVTLRDRPDLEREMFEVDREASADIPGLASTHVDRSFEAWRGFAIERPSRDHDLTFLALADGHVVGVAYMENYGDRGIHNLTGVRREWRGRGVATALKRAQIAGAHRRGLKALVTESQHENEPMRTLNLKLGYAPTVANIVYRGPLPS